MVMPRFRTANAGNALANAERVKGARMQNQLLGYQVEGIEQQREARKLHQQMQSEFDKTPDLIKAYRERGMHDQANQALQGYLGQRKAAADMIKTLRGGINKENYSGFRRQMIEMGVFDGEEIPSKYSDDWFNEEEMKERRKFDRALKELDYKAWHQAKLADQKHSQASSLEDRKHANDMELQDLKSKQASLKAKHGSALDTADMARINKMVNSVFDSAVFNENGEIDLVGEDARKALAITEKAMDMFAQGHSLQSSVTTAAREFGMDIPGDAGMFDDFGEFASNHSLAKPRK